MSHVELSGRAGRPDAKAGVVWGEEMMKTKHLLERVVDPAANLESAILGRREKKCGTGDPNANMRV